MKRFIALIVVILAMAAVYYYTQRPVKEPTPRIVAEKTKTAPVVTAVRNPHWKKLLADYESFLRESVDAKLAPGVAVAIVVDNSVIMLKGIGISDAGTNDSVDVFSIFRLGSVSKSLASVLTGVLVQDSILHWDDKVIEYLPDFKLKTKESTEQITIRHLLSHTSGLPYHAFTDRIDEGASLDPLIYHLRDLNLTGPPGQTYNYQNVAYSVIGKIIEKATGQSYETVMMQRIFEPLNMQQASMNFESMVGSPDKARPHVRSLHGWKPMPISHTYYNVGPAGGVNASISDMARWMLALTSSQRQILRAGTRDEMFKPMVKATSRNRYFRQWKKSSGSYYSLGWRVLTFKDDTLNYHGGYVNGFRSEVAIKERERIGICVLVNSPGLLADRAIPEFFLRYEKYRRKILEWDRADPMNSIALLSEDE